MSKHTPGPWYVEPMEAHPQCFEVMADGFYVATTHDGVMGDSNAKANARLIASAPELLEALQDCLAFLERDMPVASSGPERRKARAAIAKATGEQE